MPALTSPSPAEHLTLAVGERVGFRPGLGGQLGVDHTLAGANAADGVGQRGGGGVLKRPGRRSW